jgi:hypothetical protein
MIQLKKNIWVENDDNKVLSLMAHMRQGGVIISDFDIKSEKSQFLFAVNYDTGFNLYVIGYFPKKGDSGYTMLLIKNFLTENLFNLNDWAWLGFDVSLALANIYMQVANIADRINYPLEIMTAFKKDFVGLVASPMIDAN